MLPPLKRKLLNLKERLLPSEIVKEVAIAHFHKLPHKIHVNWFRDGKFIIGDIKDAGHSYLTQARSAKEFIEMVNDVVYSVYGIPQQYFKVLGENKYNPTLEEFERLNNASVVKSHMGLVKQNS